MWSGYLRDIKITDVDIWPGKLLGAVYEEMYSFSCGIRGHHNFT